MRRPILLLTSLLIFFVAPVAKAQKVKLAIENYIGNYNIEVLCVGIGIHDTGWLRVPAASTDFTYGFDVESLSKEKREMSCQYRLVHATKPKPFPLTKSFNLPIPGSIQLDSGGFAPDPLIDYVIIFEANEVGGHSFKLGIPIYS